MGRVKNRAAWEVAQHADFETQTHGLVGVAAGGPLQLVGSRETLGSALKNVVRNALRHTEKGSEIEISITWD